MYIRKENRKTVPLNMFVFAENPEKWDIIKRQFQDYIKHLKKLRDNTINLLFKKKIEYVDLFILQTRCIGDNEKCIIKHFDYNENTEQLEGNTFLKRIIFYRADSQHKIKEKLLDILFKAGVEIGNYEGLIQHYDNAILVITNQKDELIIGDVIQQLPAKLLYDLFIEIVKNDFSKFQILFSNKVFEYIRLKLQKESHKEIKDNDIYKFILSLYNGKKKPPKINSLIQSHSRYIKQKLYFQ